MRVCIRRGADRIGGTCIEIESQGKRLVLDIGQPLDCPDPEFAELPAVQGFDKPDNALLGVVLSHPHLDHYGLSYRLPATTPTLMGAAAERILKAAAVFIPSARPPSPVAHLNDRQPLQLGPFRITPFLMDHSAYDSYALLVEADDQRLFYTGDLRGHGRKAALFEKLVARPPEGVDVLIMEGTTIQRHGTDTGFPTEDDLENEMVKIFKETPGMPLVWCSGQGIDRLVTIFRASKRSGRQLIVDMYTAHILCATEKSTIPQAEWPEVRVYLPKSQKLRIVQQQRFDVSDAYKPYRIHPERLAELAQRSVMLFRPGMCRELEAAHCIDGACLVYSMWDGYLAESRTKEVVDWLQVRAIPLHKCHTSGHASLWDLRRLREAFHGAVVVPVHCADPDRYARAFDRVALHPDDEWWPVGG